MKKINRKSNKNKLKILYQFIKFGIVGLSNTILSLVVYYTCLNFGLHYILANTLSFIAGVMNAYYWNSRYVFHEQINNSNKISSILKVFFSYGSTFVISTVLLLVWVDILCISDKIAPLINLIITIPFNFILNKYWAFKKSKH